MPWYLIVIIVLLGIYLTLVLGGIIAIDRPLGPGSKCCACKTREADARVFDELGVDVFCWQCIDNWPKDAIPLVTLNITPFRGHERSAR